MMPIATPVPFTSQAVVYQQQPQQFGFVQQHNSPFQFNYSQPYAAPAQMVTPVQQGFMQPIAQCLGAQVMQPYSQYPQQQFLVQQQSPFYQQGQQYMYTQNPGMQYQQYYPQQQMCQTSYATPLAVSQTMPVQPITTLQFTPTYGAPTTVVMDK